MKGTATVIRAKKPSNGSQYAKFFFATRLEKLLTDSDFSNMAQYFVCCFSKSADDLQQLRAYADDGRGFALGFETRALSDGFMKTELPGSHNSTFPLTYDDAKIHKMLEETINNVFRFLPRRAGLDLNNDSIDYIIHKLCDVAWTQCLLLSILFKNEAYSHEVEYRFMETHPQHFHADVKHRMRPYELVTYREFNWRHNSADSLKKIIVGPAADKTKAMLFASDCLRTFHQSNTVEVVPSEIPYRHL